VIVDL